MTALDGWSEVGSAQAGPGAALVPMAGPDGELHLALSFRDDLVDHPMLHKGMDEVRDFVTAPGVDGVARLAAWDREGARFVYPVGSGVTLAQLQETLRRKRIVPGPRAVLDLLAAVGPVLDRAAAAGRRAGVYNHGALTAWRVVLGPDASASLIGYGVPPVDVMAWLDEETDEVDLRALACTPPERIEDADEDVRADLFSLGMIAAELALGRPMLDGTAEAVVDQILDGGSARALREALGGPLAPLGPVLQRLVALKPADRWRSGAEVAREASAAGRSVDGPTLASLITRAFGDADDLTDDDTSVQFSVPDYTLPIPQGALGPIGSGETTQPLDDLLARMESESGSAPPPVVAADEAEATEPVSAAEQQALLDALRPPPEPDDDTDTGPDDAELAPSVDALDDDATLERIQEHARAIVARTEALSQQARSCADELEARADEVDGDVSARLRSARQAADRASKAMASASSAANLLDLDEDAAGARITLDLVKNAEAQAESAAREAATQLRELTRVLERTRQRQQALRDAVQRARQHADAATEAADQADARITSLEEDARNGLLAAPEVDAAIDDAIAAAEAAHAAAEEARRHADEARQTQQTDLAIRRADDALAAENEAKRGLAATTEAAERARRQESEFRSASTDRASRSAAAATAAAEAAELALQRADDALAIASPSGSQPLREALKTAAGAARGAADEAERAAQLAADSPHSGDCHRHAGAAEEAAERATSAAERAREASDQIVSLAGEVAEARAEIAKRHDEARQLLESTRRAVKRARDEIDQLFDETGKVTAEATLQARAEALARVQEAEQRLLQLEVAVQTTEQLEELSALDERLEAVRSIAGSTTSATEASHRHATEARESAERELAELRRLEERRAAVAEAAAEARRLADQCREQVDAAWAVARSLSEALKTTSVEEAIRLRTKALELIDIAEFQAGEARTSADLAAAEEDPSEARAHTQTANSFLERITTDLPEAVDGLRRAEELAQKELRTLQAARDRTAEVSRTVERIARDVGTGLERARSEATEWREVPAVAAELTQLARLSESFDEDRNESTWCADQATRCELASEAAELLPRAEQALERARDKQRRAQAIAESLAKAIATAVAERQAVVNARKTAADSVHAAADLLAAVQEAEDRLKAAARAHGAHDVPVANAQLRLREARQRVELTHKKLGLVAEQAEQADDAAVVKKLAAQARELLGAAEQAREIATDAETEGIAAAEHEARAREEADRRRLQAAREDTAAQVERAEAILAKVTARLDEARDEVTASAAPQARRDFEQATQLAEALGEQLASVEGLASGAAEATDADEAEELSTRARERIETLTAGSAAVQERVQSALDAARAAAAEAEALEQVRAEVRATADKASAAVDRAKAEAKRILGMMTEANRAAVRALADDAATHIQAASKSAAKVAAAAPLAEQAETLASAQGILKTSRLALERADAAADAVRELVEEALERSRREAEDAARALETARDAAAQPVQEATAAARKAEGWLEAGQREVADHAGSSPSRSLAGALRALTERVEEVLKLAEDTAVLAGPAREAETVEAAEGIARKVRAAADSTIEKARVARAALDTLRNAVEAEREVGEATEAALAETTEHAASARQAADQAEATVQELRSAVEAAGVLDDAVQAALDEALEGVATTGRAADAANKAMARAKGAASVEDAELAADAAHDALQRAIEGLALVVEKEAVCRQALVTAAEAEEDRKRQAYEERRRREAEAQRAEDERRRQEEADQEAERRRRDEERRARFDRRREERQGKSAATDRESLRSRLKERRPPDASDVTGTIPDRPRRRGTTRSRLESKDESGRTVRSWSPSSDDAEARPRRATRGRPERAPRPTAAGPAPAAEGEEAPVDALLERLRARRSKD